MRKRYCSGAHFSVGKKTRGPVMRAVRRPLHSSNIKFVQCRYLALLLTVGGQSNTSAWLAITGIRHIWKIVRRLYHLGWSFQKLRQIIIA